MDLTLVVSITSSFYFYRPLGYPFSQKSRNLFKKDISSLICMNPLRKKFFGLKKSFQHVGYTRSQLSHGELAEQLRRERLMVQYELCKVSNEKFRFACLLPISFVC